MTDPIANSKFRVAGIGELLWDLLPTGKRLGGAPANFAAHASALGAEAWIVSALGNDELANAAFSQLSDQGVKTDFIEQNSKPTGSVKVDLINGQPNYTIMEDSAWDACGWNESLEKFAKSIDAVCYGSLFQRSSDNRKSLRQFLDATTSNCVRVFDVNLRQNFYSDEIIIQSLHSANVLKLNDEELPIVAKLANVNLDIERFLEQLLNKFDLKLIALTCGADGSWLTTKTEQDFCNSSDITVVDTVGAGDAFTAALVMGMLRDLPLAELNRSANRVATEACLVAGGMPKRIDNQNSPSN